MPSTNSTTTGPTALEWDAGKREPNVVPPSFLQQENAVLRARLAAVNRSVSSAVDQARDDVVELQRRNRELADQLRQTQDHSRRLTDRLDTERSRSQGLRTSLEEHRSASRKLDERLHRLVEDRKADDLRRNADDGVLNERLREVETTLVTLQAVVTRLDAPPRWGSPRQLVSSVWRRIGLRS